MEASVVFVCDGKKEDCGKTGCFKNGGECHHTSDINHAANFIPIKNKMGGTVRFYEKDEAGSIEEYAASLGK